MGKLTRCDVRVNCDGATTPDPGEAGWSLVLAGVVHASGEPVETEQVGPAMLVSGDSIDLTQDSLDICPDCAGEFRAAQVTGAFVEWLREFDERFEEADDADH